MKVHRAFVHDLGIIALSILVAILLVQTGTFAHLLTLTDGSVFIDSFIAGFFFTSVFTTAPAIVVFGEMSVQGSILTISFFGALGAMVGDYIIFKFMRDRFGSHVNELIKVRGLRKRFKHLFTLRFFRQFSFLLGGIIIASPLPDELGLSLLGLSKTKTSWLLPLSFICNFAGIYVICLAARALL